jgi:Mg2+ and Co2+ transporter CorA
MRIFNISGTGIAELTRLPTQRPAAGYLWIACGRGEFELLQTQLQATLQALCGMQLVELHISDLLNSQLPSNCDYTSQYDLLVFRRLTARDAGADPAPTSQPLAAPGRHGGPPILGRIDTSPVGFAMFDQVLLTVHPVDCTIRDAYAAKLLSAGSAESRSGASRLPTSPADLMLRIVAQMVDGYLDLRRELTRQLDHWQVELLAPHTRFSNWSALLQARLALHQLDGICEDQRGAIQDWIAVLEDWPAPATTALQREYELLKVRSRDVLEHIERVVHHVRRLEQTAVTSLQMHFSAQSNRTNDIMRTLTALTAIFLPPNLITGFFGMNFEFMPLIHRQAAFWWTLVFMLIVAVVTGLVFWRKRYLARTGKIGKYRPHARPLRVAPCPPRGPSRLRAAVRRSSPPRSALACPRCPPRGRALLGAARRGGGPHTRITEWSTRPTPRAAPAVRSQRPAARRGAPAYAAGTGPGDHANARAARSCASSGTA